MTIQEMKRMNKEAGQFWFSPQTLRFFNSRISSLVVQAEQNEDLKLFVTSERMDWNSPRLYSVRVFNYSTCKVDTVGEFQEYATLEDAKAAAKRLAKTM